ncbi:MAG: glycosyltransferase family 2 protein [Candidatus Omnitrophica bacterium]|nr:glycosyltransferase family 2 protein [Candidatus Omnitrophota bacterium]
MKLFIQIPCLNEEKTLTTVIDSLPCHIDGIDEIYTVVIDDGSTDRTVEVAKSACVDYIIKNNNKLGLARTFCKGIEFAIALGADIIVNIDGDNQYKGKDIVRLIKPILEKKSDIVVGCRDFNINREQSFIKRILQKVGSKIVCHLSGIDIPDTTSRFRAINAVAARKIVIRCLFSYTLEMLCQSKRVGLAITWIPIIVNKKTRESRLFKSNFEYVYEQTKVLIMVFLQYYPLGFFVWSAIASFSFFLLTGIIKLYFFGFNESIFKLDIVIFFSFIITILSIFSALVGSILASLHLLLIDLRSRIRRIEFTKEDIFDDFDIIITTDFFAWVKARKISEHL